MIDFVPRHIMPQIEECVNYYPTITDTGLLCSLLGIRNPMELTSHPMRGQIFENHVVAEMKKQTDIERHRTSLFFYRENRGVEVDLIKEKMIGVNYELYEIKSSKTYRADFSTNMKRA